MNPLPSNPPLLWDQNSVTTVYKKQRIWPTFVGVRENMSKRNGHLPVLLWPEHTRQLRQKLPDDSEKITVIGSSIESAIITESSLDDLSAAVFKTLYSDGWLIGPGGLYGGQYCIYRESPAVCHASATVRVVRGISKISAKDFLSFTRVQTQVAKAAVLAFQIPVSPAESEDSSAVQVGLLVVHFDTVSSRS